MPCRRSALRSMIARWRSASGDRDSELERSSCEALAMAVSGVRSSCETPATKSLRSRS
ncbi:MAG: hypothetical protein BWY94_02481 [Actinobacteria bacterium ADurb.BinA094]|nr:MAG: hypothetical protein BWY94_02481 [Actinobacteria bacterium ADurb.BinA094]